MTSTALLALEATVHLLARGVPVSYGQLADLPFLLALSLAYASLGSLLGLHLREVWAGIVAVAVSFLAFLLAATGLLPATFVSGGATGSLVGQSYRPAAMALLFLSAAGLAAALLALLHARFGGRRRAMGAVVVLGLGALLVGYAPRLDLEGRLELARVDLVCRGSRPALCMARETPLLAGKGAVAIERMSRVLVQIGVELPGRWVQELYVDQPRDAGEFIVFDNAESTGRLSMSDVALSLAHPAACPSPLDEPSRSLNARYRLAGWIAVRNGLQSLEEEEGAGFSSSFEAWARSPESEPWVRSTYRRLRACRLHEIAPPPR